MRGSLIHPQTTFSCHLFGDAPASGEILGITHSQIK